MAIIEPNLNATLMRNQMETKNELSAKGSLYVGTGNTTPVEYIGADGTTATTNVPVTTHIAPNGKTDDGKILIVDSVKPEGWKIDKIGNDNITDGTITGDKLAENFTYSTSDTGSFCLQDSSNNSTPRLSFIESNNRASVALQADLKSQELDGKSFTLTVPNKDGTLATKEQIENGEIVAKTAQNATTAVNATTADNAQKLAFFEQGWTELSGGIRAQQSASTDIVGTWSLPYEDGMDTSFLRLDMESPSSGGIATMGFWVPPIGPSKVAASPVLSLLGKNNTRILCQCAIESFEDSIAVYLMVIDSNIASFYFGQDGYSYKMYYKAYIK